MEFSAAMSLVVAWAQLTLALLESIRNTTSRIGRDAPKLTAGHVPSQAPTKAASSGASSGAGASSRSRNCFPDTGPTVGLELFRAQEGPGGCTNGGDAAVWTSG